jgi:hypothetical protein
MPDMTMPPIKAVHSVRTDSAKSELVVTFISTSGGNYVVRVPSAVLDGLTLTMMSLAPKLKDPKGKGRMIQPQTLTGARQFVLPDGRGGLELTIDGQLKVPLVFPPDAIRGVRTALEQLEALLQTSNPGTQAH